MQKYKVFLKIQINNLINKLLGLSYANTIKKISNFALGLF